LCIRPHASREWLEGTYLFWSNLEGDAGHRVNPSAKIHQISSPNRGDVAGYELDEVGLTTRPGLLEQMLDMGLHRCFRDPQHRTDRAYSAGLHDRIQDAQLAPQPLRRAETVGWVFATTWQLNRMLLPQRAAAKPVRGSPSIGCRFVPALSFRFYPFRVNLRVSNAIKLHSDTR
jgi:hypothetical protein